MRSYHKNDLICLQRQCESREAKKNAESEYNQKMIYHFIRILIKDMTYADN